MAEDEEEEEGLPHQQHQLRPRRSFISHRISALILTFVSYASFHASRKPPSIAKSTLSSTWAPFDSDRGSHLLGLLDLAFLSSYSLSMLLLSGPLADRLPLSPLLLSSSLLSSLSLLSLSLSFFLHIHSLSFFLITQIISGVVQSLAWPCVVAVIGNWFGGSDKKGLIMGIWNSHTSVGNILGSIMASAVLEFGWGWSFALPGVVMAVVGFGVYWFLVANPRDAGFGEEEGGEGVEIEMVGGGEREDVGLLGEEEGVRGLVEEEERAIGFLEAWRLPGVAPFAFCLFFSKLVAYTFLYWLPFYIQRTRKFHLTSYIGID